MPAINVSLTADQLTARMQARLRGLSAASPNTILWEQQGSRALIYVNSLTARVLTGWLLCNLDLQAGETGRQTLHFVFYLGALGQGDGLRAGGTVKAANPQASQLAAVWGTTIQRVLWDAVLDGLEAFVDQTAAQHQGLPIAIQGFHGAQNALSAVILAGDK